MANAKNITVNPTDWVTVKNSNPPIVLKDFEYSNRNKLDRIFQDEMSAGFNDDIYKMAANLKGLSKIVYRKDGDEAELIGGVCSCVVKKHSIYVLAMARKKEYHKEHIGRKMMDHIFDFVERNKKYKDIRFHVADTNENAKKIAIHFDFQKSEQPIEKDFYEGHPEWRNAHYYEIKRENVVSSFKK